jgi:hypothetical protein
LECFQRIRILYCLKIPNDCSRPGFGYSDFGDAQNLKGTITKYRSLSKKSIIKPLILVDIPLADQLARLAVDNPSWSNGLVILAGSLDESGESEKWRTVIKASPLRYLEHYVLLMMSCGG